MLRELRIEILEQGPTDVGESRFLGLRVRVRHRAKSDHPCVHRELPLLIGSELLEVTANIGTRVANDRFNVVGVDRNAGGGEE